MTLKDFPVSSRLAYLKLSIGTYTNSYYGAGSTRLRGLHQGEQTKFRFGLLEWGVGVPNRFRSLRNSKGVLSGVPKLVGNDTPKPCASASGAQRQLRRKLVVTQYCLGPVLSFPFPPKCQRTEIAFREAEAERTIASFATTLMVR
jgi:hypothetical protein